MGVLSGLKPEKVFKYFEEITRIPRGSYNEKAVSDYIVEFARERGLEVYQDDLYNVIIIKEASKGREKDPAVILQGHIDMVNEKAPDSTHDFMKDPLDIYIDGDFIKAKGTTLGGDDGIAVAYMMAILDDPTVDAPRLEMVFTVSEEVGMEGASGIDLSNLKGKLLLNLDSEDEGILLAGCAGGMRGELRLPLSFTDCKDGKVYELKISGLLGGHSGSEIDKQRINADHMLARVLNELMVSGADLKILSMCGGGKDNAIPFEAAALVRIDDKDKSLFTEKLKAIEESIKNEYRNTDGGVRLSLEESNVSSDKVLTDESLRKAVGLILAVPNGIVKMSGDIKGLVETSLNLGIMRTEEDTLILTYALRSSVDSAKEALRQRVSLIADCFGAKVCYHGAYPAWEYKKESLLRDKMIRVFEEMYGKKPEVSVIHAGVECGLLAEKIDGLDAISFGPDLFDIHTVNERLSISSAARTYDYLLKILATRE